MFERDINDTKISKEEYIDELNKRKAWLKVRLDCEIQSNMNTYGFVLTTNPRIEMINKYIDLINLQIDLCNREITKSSINSMPAYLVPAYLAGTPAYLNNMQYRFGNLSKYAERHIPNEREEFLGKVDIYIMKLSNNIDLAPSKRRKRYT